MSITRNNHYVPQWYQEGFFEPGLNTLSLLDLAPPQKTLPDGRVVTQRSKFTSPTSRAFRERDLYSTFFGTSVNDEIERRLFGHIDTAGSNAIRAFTGTDVSAWHAHFEALFEYIDVQKIRTPKGLDWLKAQYPSLDQNELMFEMQGIRRLHCTLWTEGVREIVSAESANIKFIVSDHPVTIYNHAAPPDARLCVYPNEPGIALKATQTIFPLSRNHCLILSNIEYAQDPSISPLRKRTFARNFRTTMVRTDAFIRTRSLSDAEVLRINFVIKARAKRYIAAGRDEWLYPEAYICDQWSELRKTFLPPSDKLWNFGGEIYAKFDNGDVHYQDAFGRTEKERGFLKKNQTPEVPRSGAPCGCGSGVIYRLCCKLKAPGLRPSWSERSIRERNLMLFNGIINVLGVEPSKNWTQIRRELTDEKIAKIYELYEGLWPRETDLLQLLPKPDGRARAVYTGTIHPIALADLAVGASVYFGDLIIQHPFLNAATVKTEFNPVKNPQSYRAEFIKSLLLFLDLIPLVDRGLINLVPDPCDFDIHLRDQMMQMATARTRDVGAKNYYDAQIETLMRQEFTRSFLASSPDILKSRIARDHPEFDERRLGEFLQEIEKLKESDPLCVLHAFLGDNEGGGQFSMFKLAPNFEMTMYLAQATGASIVTDSSIRWREIRGAVSRRSSRRGGNLSALSHSMETAEFFIPRDIAGIKMFEDASLRPQYSSIMRDVKKYLAGLVESSPKVNFEASLNARFVRLHARAQLAMKRTGVAGVSAKVTCLFPTGGIQDNTVNRLLLMSSAEEYLSNVPMAFFLEKSSSASNVQGRSASGAV